MAVDRRRRNEDWKPADESGTITWDKVPVALLMDIRDELQRLNNLLHCHNFTGIPATLRTISRKMPARRKQAR